jgi:selenocysteine-specific elongation factor
VSSREASALRHWTAAHLHLGAAHAMARVALLEGESLASGKDALVQIVVERPIGALAGDAFVVRDASASRTLGGGRVIDPHGRERHRRAAERLEVLRRLEEPDRAQRLAAVLEIARDGVDLRRFRIAHNASPVLELPAGAVRVEGGGTAFAFGAGAWSSLREAFVATLARHHQEHLDEMGPDLGRVRRMAFPRLEAPVVEAVARALLGEGRVARSGPWWHLPAHSIGLDAREESLAQRILPRLEDEGFEPSWVRDLARMLPAPEDEVRALMRRLGRRGDVFPVVRDLFYTRAAVAGLAGIAAALEREHGVVGAAQFRDRTGLGRKRAIQILEFFDRVGFTRRARNGRRLRGDCLLRLEESR